MESIAPGKQLENNENELDTIQHKRRKHMEIILSRHCKSFTGTLSRKHGYSICKRGKGFFGQRSGKNVPADGHLRFILDCAELAREGMLIADVRLMGEELIEAGKEAGLEFETVVPDVEYNAHDVLNIKTYYSL